MSQSKQQSYKYCVVPKCKSTTISTPKKVFIIVPEDVNLRKQWYKVMRRDELSPKTRAYCCEDHFDLESDVENYMRYKMTGGKIFMRPGVVPHKFECQKEPTTTAERPGAEKRRRMEHHKELVSPEVQASVASHTVEFVDCGALDVEQRSTSASLLRTKRKVEQ